MSEAGATIFGMDSDRPAIHALTAAVAVIRARNGVPGPAPTVVEVAAIVDGQPLPVEPITVLVTARDFGIWAAHTGHRLRSLEPDYQRAWQRWDNERFRDLIHQTLDLGGALTRARHIVNAASTAAAQNGRDPYRVPLPASVWAQAMFLVSAEAADVLNLIELLELAITEGNHIHAHRDTALTELEIAEASSVGALARLEHLRLAEDAAVAARRRWSNPPRRYAGVGGLPRMGQVGTGLDQLVVVQLLSSAETLTRQVAIMADHPSVSTYVSAAAAEGLDLVTHVPAALTDSRHA